MSSLATVSSGDAGPAFQAVRRIGFGPSAVPYEEAWELQRQVHADVVAGRTPDTVLLLEHPSVYTAGKRTDPSERPDDGTPVVEVDRGGKITWHGPGQLVGYPIVRLAAPIDVVAYVRRLEQVLIDVARDFGVPADRVPGNSGAWLPGEGGAPDRKIGAIGIRVSRQVTMHGFSFNVCNDLTVYDRVVACGLPDAEATSLSQELGRPVSLDEVLPVLERRLGRVVLGGVPRALS